MCHPMLMSNRSCKNGSRNECVQRGQPFCCLPLCLLFLCSLSLSNAHFILLRGEDWKSRARRGGHTATFLSVLCWVGSTLPLRGWWGGMALWRNQPGASIAVIIIWIQDCWICNFGPLHGWEMTCLRWADTLSVCNAAAFPPPTVTLPWSSPVSTGGWVHL